MKIPFLPCLSALVATLTIQTHAAAILRITEVMSSGDTADWFEVTNYGDATADLTGAKMDDNSFSFASSVALNGVTAVAPGESVIFIEGNQATADTFKTNWGAAAVPVGFYSGAGVGLSSSGDGVVVFNSTGTEITPRTSFGAATAGTTFYWSYDSAGTLATAALGTLTASTLPGYVTWLNNTTTMQGTPGAAVVSGAASYLYWKGGAGTWAATGGTDWRPLGSTNGGPWSSTNTAVFNAGSGTVTLGSAVSAKALQFSVGGYNIIGTNLLTLTEGNVIGNVGTTVLATPLGGTNGLAKSGAGTIVLSATNAYEGFTSVVEGRLVLSNAAAVPSASAITTARFTTFDFGGLGPVVGGLGGVGTFTNFAGTLTISLPGSNNVRLDGQLSGAGQVIIDSAGTGAQRFDSSGQSRGDGLEKNYTGQTIVRRGVLEVDANGYPGVSGVPTRTSALIIEGTATNRGELTLTMDGGTYEFGGGLPSLPLITLAGGTIGNEASETVDIYNGFLVSGTGSVITSRGAGNGTNTFAGEFHIWGNIGGAGLVRKTGDGVLFLHNSNNYSGTWEIANGTIEVVSGASTGSGPLNLLRTNTVNGEDLGVLRGRGTVGGNLGVAGEVDLMAAPGSLAVSGNVTMTNGGRLRLRLFGESTPSVRIIATGAFSATTGAILQVDGTTAAGSYPVLMASGGIAGATNLAVNGLAGSGLIGTVAVNGNTLVLNLTTNSGTTYAAWSGGVPAGTDTDNNGFTALEEYALGAMAPGAPFVQPVLGTSTAGGTNFLTLTANIRTNGAGLSVAGQATTALSGTPPWSTNGVDFVVTGNTNVPGGCEQRIYRTPRDTTRKFLNLQFIQQ
ncbi:MAG: lamin tail domain-containing protein [Chthoniobacterales bacterium]